MKKALYDEARLVMTEIIEKAKLKRGDVLVVGCSTSEILGARIGTNSAPEVAAEVFRGLYDCATENGIYLAVQCCEHLNRAIVIEREAAAGLDAVNVIPQPKAGGSMATHAYGVFKNPVVVEQIRADAGIDIGLTLIGMHLKQVAVPVRLENNRIGEALVVAARTRPKFIGGVRAVYDEELL
ncbi:MAG: TIGR01440 family protein [Clostridia bacterium]|nr:TIGR01440 family protein [Clostridia bacterium]